MESIIVKELYFLLFTTLFKIIFLGNTLAVAQEKYGVNLGAFILDRSNHGLTGNVYVIDESTFLIKKFSYDGRAPATEFRVGKGEEPSINSIVAEYFADNNDGTTLVSNLAILGSQQDFRDVDVLFLEAKLGPWVDSMAFEVSNQDLSNIPPYLYWDFRDVDVLFLEAKLGPWVDSMAFEVSNQDLSNIPPYLPLTVIMEEQVKTVVVINPPKTAEHPDGEYVAHLSQAVVTPDLVFLSGAVGTDPITGKFVSADVAEQAAQALKNIKDILHGTQCGISLENVVKATVWLTDIADIKVVNGVYGKFFPQLPPARSCFQVSNLPIGAKVEIEVIALRGKLVKQVMHLDGSEQEELSTSHKL
ncbi:unnamed protein product, partial [Notodromas monacha]